MRQGPGRARAAARRRFLYAVLVRAVALPQNVISQNTAGLTVASQIRSSHLDTILLNPATYLAARTEKADTAGA
jgi:hypothetical protein